MAKTLLEIEGVKGFTKDINHIIRKYRTGTILSLARNLNSIRKRAATEYIIPRASGVKPYWSWYKQNKAQPSSGSKLTERKGILKRMLLQGTDKPLLSWKGIKAVQNSGYSVNKQVSLRTGALLATVKVTGGFRTGRETYRAELKTDITDTTGLISEQLITVRDIEGKPYKRYRTNETRQTLFMRFMHEKGIRGHKRPFFEPAVKKESFRTSALINEKINILGGL